MLQMHSAPGVVVVIGTGGTIAGVAPDAAHLSSYEAGTLGVQQLLAALPLLRGVPIETLNLAQIDSSDMRHGIWRALAAAAHEQLARPEVAGVVVTHGTDTLEETAYVLHRTVDAPKPLVLTAAMRPATAPSPDGPQNLLDAVTVARTPGAAGVLAVVAGRIHAGAELRKLHGWRVDAFGSGEAGPVGVVDDGTVRCFRPWPRAAALHPAASMLPADEAAWPAVDIVTSHAGARAVVIDALVGAGARGIVIAGTGNGSVHAELAAAARRAIAAGVPVRRASRCLLGGVVGESMHLRDLPSTGGLTPVQARIELMLDLIGGNE
jgi:L-asparaginase